MHAKTALRAAAYCRVSTSSEEQLGSLSSQKQYFTSYVKALGWTLYKIYADEGITGTSVEARPGFLQMMSDAREGRFELIVTKEISRFARNTLDSIYYTRELSDMGVGVYFINDNINTLDADSELRLTIMSSIAQEESRRTSQRVKWGQKRRMEEGVVFGRSLLGYDVKDGRLYINEEGAALVRRIFSMYINEKLGAHTIARILSAEKIPTLCGAPSWGDAVIRKILKNEKYAGILRQKKTITKDYLTHRRIKNNGYEDEVIIENHHKAIISKETFEAAQQIMAGRKASPDTRYSARYCFSGKLICPVCGGKLISRSKRKKDGGIYRAWKCCSAQVPHEAIMRAVREAIDLLSKSEKFELKKVWQEGSMDKREHEPNYKNKALSPHEYKKQLTKKRLRAARLYACGLITDDELRTLEREFSSEERLMKAYSPSFSLLKNEGEEEEIFKLILKHITVYSKSRMDILFVTNACATWTERL